MTLIRPNHPPDSLLFMVLSTNSYQINFSKVKKSSNTHINNQQRMWWILGNLVGLWTIQFYKPRLKKGVPSDLISNNCILELVWWWTNSNSYENKNSKMKLFCWLNGQRSNNVVEVYIQIYVPNAVTDLLSGDYSVSSNNEYRHHDSHLIQNCQWPRCV